MLITGPVCVLARRRWLVAVVVVATVFAFYLPSSVGSDISQPLSVVSIAGSCVLLAVIWLLSDRRTPIWNTGVALSIGLLLAVFTITSPFEETSQGVALLYLAQMLLFVIDLRLVRSPIIDRVFGATTLVSLLLGGALALNVGVADRFVAEWYSAFYPDLLGNMVLTDDKPVLTFATHSMAGFMIYLFFYMHLRGWQVSGGLWRLGAAVGLLGLLVQLRSTTGQAFAAIAALQLLLLVQRVPARLRALAMVVVLVAGVEVYAALDIDAALLAARVEDAIVGDEVRGLFSRYATDGLLATNLTFLSESPLSPIGLGVTDTLYLGDSGIVVNLLRGSVPLVIAVYGGLWLFLRANLVDRRAARWIWICTVLFEIGFTPLQYFRFVTFVPLLVVYMNSVATAPVPSAQLGALRAPG